MRILFQIMQLSQSLICVFVYVLENFPKYKQTEICVYVCLRLYICIRLFFKNTICKDKCDMHLHMNRLFGSVTLAYLWSASSRSKNYVHSNYVYQLFQCIFLLFILDLLCIVDMLYKYMLWSMSHWYPKKKLWSLLNN